MTLDEFVRHLQRVRDHFDEWTLVLDKGPAAERRSKPRHKLRAMLHRNNGLLILGPIGAVSFVRKGKIYLPEEWQFAAEELGMAPTTGAEIMWAANDQTWAGDPGKRKPVERLQKLRIRLLKAVDIHVEEPEPQLASGRH